MTRHLPYQIIIWRALEGFDQYYKELMANPNYTVSVIDTSFIMFTRCEECTK